MEVILGYQEVDEIVKRGFKELVKGDVEKTKRYKENKRLDCKAHMLLHKCVSVAIFQKILKVATTKEEWDIL